MASHTETLENKALVQASFDRWHAGTGSPFELLAPEADWTIVGSSRLSKTYGSRQAFLEEVIQPFNVLRRRADSVLWYNSRRRDYMATVRIPFRAFFQDLRRSINMRDSDQGWGRWEMPWRRGSQPGLIPRLAPR